MPIAADTVIATSITFEAHIDSFDQYDSSFNFVDRKSMPVVVDLFKIAGQVKVDTLVGIKTGCLIIAGVAGSCMKVDINYLKLQKIDLM